MQTIEVDPSTKVTEVKASICAAFGKFEPTGLKVIHSGKVGARHSDDDDLQMIVAIYAAYHGEKRTKKWLGS